MSNYFFYKPSNNTLTGVAWNNSMVQELRSSYNDNKFDFSPYCVGLSSKIYVGIFAYKYPEFFLSY